MSKEIIIQKEELLSDNWYKLKKYTYTIHLENGTVETHTREAYDRGNGSTVLLYNPTNRNVILTEQFRLPTYINGNESGLLIETCAGLLDKDNPENCIRREAEEETGYTVNKVQKIFEAYMSPGSVTEILHFFIAAYDETMKINSGGGVAHEQEHIKVMEIPFEKAIDMIKSGEIKDGKTIMLLQYLEINKANLFT